MRRLLPLLALPLLLLTACGGTDEAVPITAPASADDVIGGVDSGIAEGEPDPNAGAGGAAGSCLAGDPNCTDESTNGQDVARPMPLADELPESQEARSGEADGATGQILDAVTADGTTVGLAWSGGACDVVQDVLVQESDTEVRILVLAGMEMGTDACTQQLVQWSTTVELDAELGDRTVLDLAG